jgi:hypothetical protein
MNIFSKEVINSVKNMPIKPRLMWIGKVWLVMSMFSFVWISAIKMLEPFFSKVEIPVSGPNIMLFITMTALFITVWKTVNKTDQTVSHTVNPTITRPMTSQVNPLDQQIVPTTSSVDALLNRATQLSKERDAISPEEFMKKNL